MHAVVCSAWVMLTLNRVKEGRKSIKNQLMVDSYGEYIRQNQALTLKAGNFSNEENLQTL